MVALNGPARLGEPDPHGVRLLVLNRPDKANALSAQLVDELHACLDAIGPETRVLVIRGEGKHFCAGFDFTEYEEQSEGDLLLRFVRISELLARLRQAPYQTLSWVHGAAYGAGADIACACAWRVGTDSARFRFPGFQFGLALGTRRLAAVVGSERARVILARNEELDASAAHACGLLTALSRHPGPEAEIDELIAGPGMLDAHSLRMLNALTDADDPDRDLAELVRSAARPGLHERVRAYRTRVGSQPRRQ